MIKWKYEEVKKPRHRVRTSKIINGHAYTDDDTALLTDLPEEQQKIVLDWIKNNILLRKTPNYRYSSYGIKHLLQADKNIYLTNNQFKDAMLMCAFYPANQKAVYWNFYISNKSPAFEGR